MLTGPVILILLVAIAGFVFGGFPGLVVVILADITRSGLESLAIETHFFYGMRIRNTLRRAGYTEGALGVGNLDDVWAELVYEAVRGDCKGSL